MICGRSGRITLGTFFLLFLIAGAVYLTLVYLPPWMAYRAMLDAMQEQIGVAAASSDGELRDRIMATAKEWEVPITREQIAITRTETRIVISAEWDVPVNLLNGQYRHVLHFTPSTDTMVMPAGH